MNGRPFFVVLALLIAFGLGIVPPTARAATRAQAVCSQTYTVKAGDTLANIALALLGNRDSYNLIADATNAAHTADPTFALVQNVNKIEIGWKLCIPERVTGMQVRTEGGIVEAFPLEDVISFKGIPYAAPPVGDLRWRATQPVVPWEGVRRAFAFGHDCMQVVAEFEPLQTTPSENCLFVNVWRPAEIPEGTKLPVMVWTHGGGWVGGGSSIPFYDGSEFARQGIVVVSFNYRLGRFGFFAHPALLAANADNGLLGNYGYMDQIAALKWVQNNIAEFGGDPSQVTLVGESAGGGSVLAMLTSPLTEGLFQRVMVMSGGGRNALVGRPMTGGTRQDPSADMSDSRWADSLGIRGEGTDALTKLRALPASEVAGDLTLNKVLDAALDCVKQELLLNNQCEPAYQGTHMFDGVIVTGEPGDLLASGSAANVPMIIGTTAADLPEFFTSPRDPFAFFGADAEAAKTAYNAPAELNLQSRLALLLSIASDRTMHAAARYAAQQITAHGSPAWLYRFTYTAESTRPDSVAQAHAGELPFMFNTIASKYGGAITANDRATAEAFNTYVGNFVKTANPNGGGLPNWPAFEPGQYDVMNFTLTDGPVYGPDPRAAGIQLVEKAEDAQ